jgi:predicted alpha/beta-hydrolase family hydrolase
MSDDAELLTIDVGASRRVSGLLLAPADSRACYVLAHGAGAGAGMRHSFLSTLSHALAARGIATLRYQFPYMENGSMRPDSPAIAHATVRAAVAEAARRFPSIPLVAGGKSFGGRMTSQAQAQEPLPSVRGIAFVGFPLHPAGKPSDERARHLDDVRIPMLFLQGTRDDLADLALLRPIVARLGDRVRLVEFDDADHSFHVRARSGQTDAGVLEGIADAVAAWIDEAILPRNA